MRPPRRRTPRLNQRSTAALRATITNLTSAIVSLLLLRVATLLVPNATDSPVPRYIRLATEPLIWPFAQVPLLDNALTREVLVADVLLIIIVLVAGLALAGILTGWRESTTPEPPHIRPF